MADNRETVDRYHLWVPGVHMKLKQFQIDEKFLCSITVKKETTLVIEEGNLLLAYSQDLKPGNNVVTTTSWEDHPEFTKLRNLLKEQGYIRVESGWWNGDQVLKSFSLNGYTFRKHDKFPCASAIKNAIQVRTEFGSLV